MNPRNPLLAVASILTMVMAISHVAAVADAGEAQGPTPAQFRAFVTKQVELQQDFQEGDIVTAELATSILTALENKKWTVADKPALLEKLLPANDFLVKILSDDKGRKFLRKIESLPGGIDRVDRLARMPQGEASVRDLVRKIPDGAEWIKTMTTTKRGDILGQRLSNSRSGKNFNKNTGHIYTLEDLMKAMYLDLTPVGS